MEEFRQAALKRANLDEVMIQWPEGVSVPAVDSLMLKHLLLCLVEDSVNIISEQKGKHNHWSQDPVHLGVLRKIFGRYLDVKGVCTSLHAEQFPLPMPFLRTESAPYRLIIRGEVKKWTVKTVEDLRTLTGEQLNKKIFAEDWVVAIFGSTAKDKDYWDIDRARGRATRHHIQPRVAMFTPREDEGPISLEELTVDRTTTAFPYDNQGPKVVIRDDWTKRDSSRAALESGRWTGTSEFVIQAPPTEDEREEDPALREADAREEVLDQEPVEEQQEDPPIEPPRRSNFDFRRVLVRLPRLSKEDPQQAKRLLLGLHERFWHAGAGDMQSMLTRAGLPADTIRLVPEVIASCKVCRRFARLKSRPKVRVDHPATFNEEVQVDYFRLWDTWFMIIVDVATRYKTIVKVAGRDLPTAMNTLLHHWLRYFGPMQTLVSDQETSLMSHEAAAEMERLNISRSPAGTTRGGAQGQHTTTGVVEKHTDLAKLCMMKLRAEAERQGLDIDLADIAAEASFAQNATLNIGGYSPHMMVIGTLPMPYYDFDSPGIQAVTGARTGNPSLFERALRLRQMALTAATQSIMEDRIARASHTRPQRVPLEDLKPGVSEVEFHREDQDGFGWRGPANLLKLQENGSAIVEYQGRPYLIPLRNLRLFRGAYYINYNLDTKPPDDMRQQELESWLALRRLMQSTEAMVPYRIDTYGHLKNHRGKWTTLPTSLPQEQRQRILSDVTCAAKFLTAKECHGIRVGIGLKKMLTPEGTTGTLVAWRRRTVRMSIADNPQGTHVSTVPFRISGKEDMCYMYFYSYVDNFVEPPESTWLPRGTPMEESPVVPLPDPPQPQAPEPQGQKRDGPESRTVVLGPESKKQRVQHMAQSEFMHEVFWEMHRRQWICRIPDAESSSEDLYEPPSSTNQALFNMRSPGWHADLLNGNIFKVDTSTDSIEEHQVYDIWDQVEEADFKEISQFVEENAFKPILKSELESNCALIDGIWVRKWKKLATGQRAVKSRMCVRGCHDPWKDEMNNRSATATRLSQRLILSTAANNNDDAESWDIAGAFLKGLTYQDLWKHLKKLGLHTVERLVAITPPMNVWRHLKKLSKLFDIPEDRWHHYVLLCLKPVYGLSEAPLAWQLFLHQYLRELGGVPSHFDECFYYWPAKQPGQWPVASMSTHVDDLAVRGKRKWLDETYNKMLQKFGKLTRQELPFMHCGCRYSRIKDGFKVDQSEYVSMLQPAKIDPKDDDNRDLTAAETTTLRSVIGGLMWTSLTRPDVLAELSTLQSFMNKAKVRHLKNANELIARAKADKEAAIYYRALQPTRYRIVVIHDASAASSTKNYAQEGVLVFLMQDTIDIPAEHLTATDDFAKYKLSGIAQLLHMQSNKAKRVSYSTSHGETLAAINGLECATLVSTRLAEITFGPTRPSLKQLLDIQERGSVYFPVDAHTDCRDFYELATGTRTLPQDKSQRLYIMAHREARAQGRVRWLILTPTECMTADALTKTMQSPCLMSWLTSGCVRFWNTGHPLEMKRLPPPSSEVTEEHLIEGDASLRRGRSWTSPTALFALSKRWYSFGLAIMMMTPATAYSTSTSPAPSTTSADILLLLLVLMVAATSSSVGILFDRWWSRSTSTKTTSSSTTDKQTWTEEDNMERDKRTLLYVASLEGDNLKLREHNRSLTNELRQARERAFEQKNRIDRLQDELLLQTASSSSTTRASTTAETAHRSDIWITKGGKRFHRQSCIYAQGGSRYSACAYCHRDT